MAFSFDYFQRCAADTGFSTSTLEKVSRLGEVAGDITRHPFLGTRLLLKGGTALNLCFGPPARLSVDLDYNYVGRLGRTEMLEERPQVEATIEELVNRLGYRIQRSAEAFAARIFYLNYASVLGGEGQIKVDLNYLYREPLEEPVERELWQPGELDRPTIRTVSSEELCVGKMLALLDRMAVRDVWDVGELSPDLKRIVQTSDYRSWFIALAATLPRPLVEYDHTRIEKAVTAADINNMLIPMLINGSRLDPEGLVDRMWLVMDPVLDLSESEQEYVAEIQRGILRSNLIFPSDAEKASRLERHPAVQWKLMNMRKHLSGGRES